jgi:hypothetical protein
MARYPSELPTEYEILDHGLTVQGDLHIVRLWSALGLTVTALFFALGFGAEIAQAMAVAG